MTQDFTHEDYRRLLRLTRERYPIRGFEVLDVGWAPDDRFAILRHDIDVSPGRARDLAEIEAEEGVKSTYTVLLSSDFYNPLEPRTRDSLRRIADFGHDIGLHFDVQWHRIENHHELDAAVRWQADVLQRALEVPVECFSFHNTTPFSMSCQASHYGGLRNAYAEQLQAGVSYISDSNGLWQFRTWDELLEQGLPRIQILTHADWWTGEPLSPAQKICTELEQRSRDVWHHYCELLEGNARLNRCDIAGILPQLRRIDPDVARLWLSGFTLEAIMRLRRRAVAEEISVRAIDEQIDAWIGSGVSLESTHALAVLTRLVEQFTEIGTK